MFLFLLGRFLFVGSEGGRGRLQLPLRSPSPPAPLSQACQACQARRSHHHSHPSQTRFLIRTEPSHTNRRIGVITAKLALPFSCRSPMIAFNPLPPCHSGVRMPQLSSMIPRRYGLYVWSLFVLQLRRSSAAAVSIRSLPRGDSHMVALLRQPGPAHFCAHSRPYPLEPRTPPNSCASNGRWLPAGGLSHRSC